MPLIGSKGTLQERPIPRLLVGLRSEQATGLVELREISGTASKIYVRGGLPVHVVGPDSLDRLDLMLVEAGLLSGDDMARAQAVRESTGRLMGQVLCELGLVGADQLAEVLRWQVRRKVTRLFSAEDGSFAVTDADHPFALSPAAPGAAVDPRCLVFPGILASYSESKLGAELGPLTGRLVRLRPVSSAQLNELGFESRHSPLLMHLRMAGFRIYPAWITGSVGPRPREAKAILLALFYLDLLEVVDRGAVPLATAGNVPSGAIPLAPAAQTQSGAIPIAPASRGQSGAFPIAPASRTQSGAIPIAPASRAPTGPLVIPASGARSAGPVTPPPSPALTSVAAMPARTATPPPTPSKTLTPLPASDPAQLYGLAQRLFSNGDLHRAEAAFEAVARADAGNQRVRAFLIWIHFWKSSEAQRQEALELTVRTLREVLKSEQNFALGHYFVGALAKLQKDMARAEQAFRTALQHDPNLMEAQRELRLMMLRKTQR